MDRPLVALVLAGGTGTRLYPATGPDRPKQFLDFGGDRSLLSQTVDRAGFADETYVLTRPAYADEIHDHAPSAGVLTEPEPKDTGPALVYAAHRIRDQVGECALLVLPSDHYIEGDFATTARTAARVAIETDGLVTVGIEPTRPATGYGYIDPGKRNDGFALVDRFVEKPDAATAESFVDAGYLWNGGIFAWTPTAFLDAAVDSELAPLVETLETGDAERGFDAVDSVSVDNAILETAADVYVVPGEFAWDDLGSWDALGRILDRDDDGNATLGDSLTLDATNNVLASDGHISAVGVENLVIASFDGETLVLPRDQAQRVRDVVAQRRE